MEPYQKSIPEQQRQQSNAYNLIKTGLNVGTSLVGISAFTKSLPFLSELIPQNLAITGLNKINPQLGKFVQKAIKDGFDFDEVRDFVKGKIAKMQEKPKGIFQQILGDIEIETLPESQQKQLGFLQMAAEELERKGVGPNDEPFKKLAKKVKDVLKGKTKVLEAEAMEMQPEQPMQSQQPSQQAGPGQQALMAILQKIQAQRAGGG